MKHNYIIANLLKRELREVDAHPPADSAGGGVGSQKLEAGRVVVAANGAREVRANPVLPLGEKLREGEVIFDGEHEVIDWATGEAIEMVEPPSGIVYREFLGLKAEVERLTERVAEVEERLEEFEEVR